VIDRRLLNKKITKLMVDEESLRDYAHRISLEKHTQGIYWKVVTVRRLDQKMMEEFM